MLSLRRKVATPTETTVVAKEVAILEAFGKTHAIIQFDCEGNILHANENFLRTLGYTDAEVVGRHHRIFVDNAYGQSEEYHRFWADLAAGHSKGGEFKRRTKFGEDVWIEASYCPITDKSGAVIGVAKIAVDITARKLVSKENDSKLAAIDRSQAVIEFENDGTVLDANENFLNTLGYDLKDIKGQHHSMFLDPEDIKGSEYRDFWNNLSKGQFASGEFKRVAKNGETVWIQATYNPIVDEEGRVTKVIKFATDVTARKKKANISDGKLVALSRSQAIIEFTTDGKILTANENFLNAMGYSLSEIQGKRHAIFVDSKETGSSSYASFWSDLAKGTFKSGEFKRIAKGGREVWINATYNPLYDEAGNITSVIKFASDITQNKLEQADSEGQLNAISKSQAVIEFNPDGTIRTANENFLNTLGYRLDEIRGKHHSMFVGPEMVSSHEYQGFWQSLRAGDFQSGEFCRFGKGGKQIWIQATYNPILDPSGRVIKIVKYASDITAQKMVFEDITKELERVSNGDLTARLTDNHKTNFPDIHHAFNHGMNAISEMVGGISQSSSSVQLEAQKIATNSMEVSHGAENQAAALEETAAAMEEFNITLKNNAENTRVASGLAQTAGSLSGNGEAVAQDAVAAMERVEDSSKKINEITAVIESIAVQTNLLSLNAAVEAARAGAAGSGFAVVASEVRTLAQKSADAAKEITQLIKDSSSAVESGVKLVKDTGSALKEINQEVNNVVAKLNDISKACDEQALGVTEVSEALSALDHNTQTNANMAARTSSSVKELTGMIQEISQRANAFVTTGSQHSPHKGRMVA